MKLRLATPSVLVDVGRLATSLTSGTPVTSIAIGGLTRHHDVEHSDVAARARSVLARRGRRGRRSAGAPPRHARRLARARRSRVRPSGGRPRARRHHRGRGVRAANAASPRPSSSATSSRPRSRPTRSSPRCRSPRRTAPGWAFEKFNRRAQDWAIVGVAAVGGDDPGVALVNMGSTPLRATAVEAALREWRVADRRR